jgi:hypothetical protein
MHFANYLCNYARIIAYITHIGFALALLLLTVPYAVANEPMHTTADKVCWKYLCVMAARIVPMQRHFFPDLPANGHG